MKIYTKTGDDGTTSLFGGRRVIKSDPQVKSYGAIDELSSFIGLVSVKVLAHQDKQFLTNIQKDLYSIMSLLSGTPIKNNFLEKRVVMLEKKIDEIETKLPKLTRFILPQGNEASSLLHIARAVCRRAERETIQHFRSTKKIQSVLQYLNRLSDFLFVLARFYNKKEVFARK